MNATSGALKALLPSPTSTSTSISIPFHSPDPLPAIMTAGRIFLQAHLLAGDNEEARPPSRFMRPVVGWLRKLVAG